MQYTPTYGELRKDQHIVGDMHLSVNLRRAALPKEEIKSFFERFQKQLVARDFCNSEQAASLQSIGSTRQYLETDFQKPYAGDLDLILQTDVVQEELAVYVQDHYKKILDKQGIKYDISFGNISLFVPVQQEATGESLYIQVDIMLAPNNPGAYDFMKTIRYYSDEPYVLLEGKYYLKGVHTALLLERMLHTKGLLMDNLGIYRERFVPVRDDEIKRMIQKVREDKKQKTQRKTKKLKDHDTAIEQRLQDGFPLVGQVVTAENRASLLPGKGVLYEEIEKCLIQKEYETDFAGFLRDTYEREQVSTMEEGLNVLGLLYQKGLYTEEEIQQLFLDYAKRLQKKNKGVLRFTQLEQMIVEKFPFVKFDTPVLSIDEL